MGTKPNLIEVTLDKVHTHAGREHQPGEVIDVSLSEARFLLNHKVIKEISSAAIAKAEKAEAEARDADAATVNK